MKKSEPQWILNIEEVPAHIRDIVQSFRDQYVSQLDSHRGYVEWKEIVHLAGMSDWVRIRKGRPQGAYIKGSVDRVNGRKATSSQFYRLWRNSYNRSRKLGFEFNLTIADIERVAQTHCPFSGVELDYSANAPIECRASIDRIDNTRGYTPDNIQIVSLIMNIRKKTGTNSDLIVKLIREGGHMISNPKLLEFVQTAIRNSDMVRGGR
jgi:hypothetical protein